MPASRRGRKQAETEEQRRAAETAKKKNEETDAEIRDMEAAKLKNMAALKREHAHLESRFSRNRNLRQVGRVVCIESERSLGGTGALAGPTLLFVLRG